jgi:hypothetical protein
MNFPAHRPVRAISAAIAAVLLAALFLASVAQAGQPLEFEIVNESGRSPEEIFITLDAGEHDPYKVPGITQNEPVKLSDITNGTFDIEELVAGRVFVAYKKGVHIGEVWTSPTRFDWTELTYTGLPGDVANLTAVDQFGIGMKLESVSSAGTTLETLGDANSDTIFEALQKIPGGPGATIRNPQGEIVRVLSPAHSSAYPQLGEYVRSLAGQTLTLHTGLFQEPEGASEYHAAIAPDGSITLTGKFESSGPIEEPNSPIFLPAAQVLEEIYAPTTEHNNFEAAIKRDLYAGFSVGLWGGRYGNDAINFCTNPELKINRQVCPEGFNVPSFGESRTTFPPYATCDQYAAVINQFSDSYGAAYSDASKKVTVSLNPLNTKKLRLTILPDSGNAAPLHSGNPNCGAGPALPIPAPAPVAPVAPRKHAGPHATAKFLKHATLKHGQFPLGRIVCGGGCAKVGVVAKLGKKVVARGKWKGAAANRRLKLKVTKPGARLLVAGKKPFHLSIQASATSKAGVTTQLKGGLKLIVGRR